MSAEGTTVHPRDYRVSDEEREHVVQLLQKAIGRGLIDLDEFTERTDIAYSATTRSQLNVVLSDLPGLTHPDAPRPGSRPGAGPGEPASPPSDRLELVSSYANLVREGPWYVPEYVLARNRYGNTRLDFSEADFAADVVNLEVDCKWGNVVITIPEGAAVDTNGITHVKFGSIDDRTHTTGRPGKPRIVITGRVHGGTLIIRFPRRGWFGSMYGHGYGHGHRRWHC
ncbi:MULTISPECIES: DUF1707 domain-containing protein [Thermocrispum]|uniref:DUF1707 domain-containing protein n=1 Tax=Thermocrispum agreste TaxID=37925 RepID=A0A2W4JLF3_9PSEU|nr:MULTISPECIES: DUF1707 domain-containing protein [Thermocrispum]PZM99930.1 MAG: DUF1707 domain-containing protein [Thermocrispum agreste]